MKLEDLEIYNLSMLLGDEIYSLVVKWDYFNKDTLAKQWVRSVDSVSLNIGEGFGRNTYRDQRNFYYFSRGSLYESKTCLKKALNRKLITYETYKELFNKHETLAIKLNKFIQSVTKLMNSTTNE
ncbi:MAG: four helix bundle protein [Petrimonas sp.]|nr:four helix bundle protein [Petrimonas sp.]